MFDSLIDFIRDLYKTKEYIALHEPYFNGNEKKYISETIDSTFVSSIGKSVELFESKISEYTGIEYAVATMNGTAALHTALKLAGVEENTEVITQSLSFVATSNAISYCGAQPIFIDVNKTTAGLCPLTLKEFLSSNCEIRNDGFCWNKTTGKKIIACLPMHTFGLPAEIDEISLICKENNLILIEDSAESLGSFYKGEHTGKKGHFSILSFNGNKVITTGSGGMILTKNREAALRAKHITTTSKISHLWEFNHDEIGFNYRLPNLNAALGLAQIEKLPSFIENKRWIAKQYHQWGRVNDVQFFEEPIETKSNYWLNILITKDREERDRLLSKTNENNIMTRPAWIPMHKLEIYEHCNRSEMTNTEWLFDRLVAVPSSVVKSRLD